MAKRIFIPEAAVTASDKLGINLSRLNYLDGFLQKLVDDERHAFVAFHALRRGVKIFEGNYGVRAPGGKPLGSDVIYPVQSVTKTIVATCAAIMQEDGLIDFWDPVAKYFPEFTGEGKDGVSLWNLLCHTSGMSDDAVSQYTNDKRVELGLVFGDDDSEDKQLDAYMKARDTLGLSKMERSWEVVSDLNFALTLRAPLAHPAGTQFEYNSTCYHMMKLVIEARSGMTLEAYARQRIFVPLKMDDTYWVLPKSKHPRFVRRDPTFQGGEYINSEYMMTNTGAGGGLKTTMPDLTRFGQMYLQNGTLDGQRILSPASVRLLTTDQNSKLPDSSWFGRMLGANWGLGWDVKNGKKDDLGLLRSERSYNHGGYGGARLLIDPDAELVLAMYLVIQYEQGLYDDMSNAVNILYSAFD